MIYNFSKMYLFNIINFRFLLVFVLLIYANYANAEIVKPNNGIEPIQVVKIQLRGLKNNDSPSKDIGIEQTWEFAHPDNQRFTGPLEKFKMLLKSPSYSMLLNHKQHEVKEVFSSDKLSTFEVIILNGEKKYFKFKWQVEKYDEDGPLKDCWLTTAVSQPIDMGSSI